jgi:putative endonuclease
MYYTYILLSLKDNKLYTGYSNDLQKRIKEHKSGKVFSTKYRLPIKLIYYEACLSEKDAKRREKTLKSGRGKAYLTKRLKEFLCSGFGPTTGSP